MNSTPCYSIAGASRHWLRVIVVLCVLSAAVVAQAAPADSEPISPAAAIARLAEGNRRFAAGKIKHLHESRDWRAALENEQHPFAIVLGCADSRVPPELVFDQGFGDLFVIRVAGNVVDTDVVGSVEYGVDHLHTKLIVVLGHTHCGAVTAVLDHVTESPGEPNEIVSLLYRIEPAVVGLPKKLDREGSIRVAVARNVMLAVHRLAEIPDLMKSQKKGKLQIVGAVYNMHTGKVEFLDQKRAPPAFQIHTAQ